MSTSTEGSAREHPDEPAEGAPSEDVATAGDASREHAEDPAEGADS